jgi:hypothetical protein
VSYADGAKVQHELYEESLGISVHKNIIGPIKWTIHFAKTLALTKASNNVAQKETKVIYQLPPSHVTHLPPEGHLLSQLHLKPVKETQQNFSKTARTLSIIELNYVFDAHWRD